MEKVYEFLKNSGVYYLATIEDNKPKVRPFGSLNIFEGKLYVLTGKKKDVSKQIQANPNVEISAMAQNGKWIRIKGKMVRDDRYEAKLDMLDNNPDLKSMYSVDDDNTEVLYIKNAKATICSFTEEPKVIEF